MALHFQITPWKGEGSGIAADASALDEHLTNWVPCAMANMCRTVFCAACAPAGLPLASAAATATVVEAAAAMRWYPSCAPRASMRLCTPCICGDTLKKAKEEQQELACALAKDEFAGAACPCGVAS
jgi:hypothetical protein